MDRLTIYVTPKTSTGAQFPDEEARQVEVALRVFPPRTASSGGAGQ